MFNKIKENWISITKGPAHLLLSKIKRNDVQSIAIYGAGEIGNELLELIKESKVAKVDLVVDRKAEYVPMQLEEFEVKKPSALTDTDSAFVVVASEKFVDEIVANINKVCVTNPKQIIRV